MRNGPNGTSALMNTSTPRPSGQRRRHITNTSSAITATNNIPCTHPANFTASGRPAKYFSGIAMKNSTSVETPSMRVRMRRRRTSFMIKRPATASTAPLIAQPANGFLFAIFPFPHTFITA